MHRPYRESGLADFSQFSKGIVGSKRGLQKKQSGEKAETGRKTTSRELKNADINVENSHACSMY